MVGIVKGTGSCVPTQLVSNHKIAGLVNTSHSWIHERTGITNRHIVETETTVSMATTAAIHAIENASIDVSTIDMIIVATMTADVIMPNVGCMVQQNIEATNAVCLDLNVACSGFIFAYHTAQAYIQTQAAKCVLVIGAESLSNIVNWEDRSTCILFGDGAGAVVMVAEEGCSYPMVMHAMGEKGAVLTCKHIYPTTKENIKQYIQMDGQAVFQFAVRQVPQSIQELVQKLEVTIDAIDLFVLHQANRRIVEAVAKRVGVPIEKFPMNIEQYGNTSSASIPILLDELNREKKLRKGMKIILCGFGAGLTWGSSYMEWQS